MAVNEGRHRFIRLTRGYERAQQREDKNQPDACLDVSFY